MDTSAPKDLNLLLTTILDEFHPTSWRDISKVLDTLTRKDKDSAAQNEEGDLKRFAKGTAFITFDYGIDGVTIEIAKYAQTLEAIYQPYAVSSIHMIGGNFQAEASAVLSDTWSRFVVEGINGWDKWSGGKWFNALFQRKMRATSEESKRLAQEIYKQAVSIAKKLGNYFSENQIALLIPVNIASNPGNLALTLGVVLATEILGIPILNSNHDFYWESGKPKLEREPGEKPGIRDHFFHNINNIPFFSLFQRLYPWKGRRWLQVNINALQSRRLVKRFGFPKENVFEISTSIGDEFFEPYDQEDVKHARLRMGHILSDGEAEIYPTPVSDHIKRIAEWMENQTPVMIGARAGLSVDPVSEDLIYLLQPTRVVSRKRIERNFALISALMQKGRLREEFEQNPNRQLVLHITGPTPQEHQADLEKILDAYQQGIETLPPAIANRIFVAFSAGQETHPSFAQKKFAPLTIETIYRMADVVLFPSETEGRGLPIIEACAVGVPIICSRYQPQQVFDDVVGKGLPKDLQLNYLLFPKGKFDSKFLSTAADLFLKSETYKDNVIHNQHAVRLRYSREAFQKKFEQILERLKETV